jgi:hypothetical protein
VDESSFKSSTQFVALYDLVRRVYPLDAPPAFAHTINNWPKNTITYERKSTVKELAYKFHQSRERWNMLLKTGERTIEEGNSQDIFIGAGMSIQSPSIWQQQHTIATLEVIIKM